MTEEEKNEIMFELLLTKAAKEYTREFEAELDELHAFDEYSEEERELIEDSLQRVNERVMKMIHKRIVRRKRIIVLSAVIAALAGIIVCTVSVTAYKSHKFRTEAVIDGDVMTISAINSDFSDKYDSITNFKYKDELIIPAWLPEGTELVNVEETETRVLLQYNVDNYYIDITAWDIEFDRNNSRITLEKNKHRGKKIDILGMTGKIVSMKYESGIKNTYIVFGSDNVMYEIVTDMSGKELNTLIKNLKYYK